MRGMVSGGAPLNPKTQEFIRLSLSCPVIQGYGLTETCAAGTVSARKYPFTPLILCMQSSVLYSCRHVSTIAQWETWTTGMWAAP